MLVLVWTLSRKLPRAATTSELVEDHRGLVAEEEEFRIVYSHMPLEGLREEYEILTDALYDMTLHAFDEYESAGEYDVIGSGDSLRIPLEDARGSVVRYGIDGATREHRRVVLPESLFEEAYALRRRSEWVWNEIAHRQHEQ